ncbi:hypothetical protein G9A89_011827 [Geosiphon pyriformis]|nr:hypothetical protein G9A89_011827 [Geosiphon pyriformis]
MIYMISEKNKPINSCVSKSKSIFNSDSNSDNDDNKNNSSSSTQYGNKNNNDLDSDSNSKTYIVLPDLSKKQKLKWFTHNTNAEFDLRYPGKDAIRLEPHSCTCINFKITLEISATTIVQLASRSSLVKKGINIKEGIIDTGYVRNIIAMLQNDSEKTYIIEPNEKIAQAIFLPLVKIAQLVLGFKFTSRIDVPINMAEEKIYMVVIEKKAKDQIQIFEAEATLCKSGKIGLINLYIPAKNHKHIKIPIYNNTGNIIEIPEGTTIGYLTTKVENQLSNIISDFSQLCIYVNITSQTIYGQEKCYLLQPKQLEQMNMKNLSPLQHIQLKMLLNNFNDIFVSKNKFGRTNII